MANLDSRGEGQAQQRKEMGRSKGTYTQNMHMYAFLVMESMILNPEKKKALILLEKQPERSAEEKEEVRYCELSVSVSIYTDSSRISTEDERQKQGRRYKGMLLCSFDNL
jgi:hypothetical protein